MIELYERADSKEAEFSRGQQSRSLSRYKKLPRKYVWVSEPEELPRKYVWAFEREGPPRKCIWFFEREESSSDQLSAKLERRGARSTLMPIYTRHAISRSFTLPVIKKLQDAIQQSQFILELGDDWDEEGSSSYSESTLKRAQSFLLKNAVQLWRRHKTCFDPPIIEPGPYGSIDLHWRAPKRELLINVPANPEEPISYYGDDKEEGTENAIRGKNLDQSTDTEWIFLWLIR